MDHTSVEYDKFSEHIGVKFNDIKLRQQGIAEHFYRNASSVGDKEGGTSIGHGRSLWRGYYWRITGLAQL